jgi:two-component sensor histidine kinase
MRELIRYLPVYKRPFWRGQAIALVTVIVALATRASIDPFIERGLYFNFLFPAVLVAGLFGGMWSGITVALLGGLLSAYIWIPPKFALALTGEGVFRLVTFWALAAMMILVTSFVHVVLDRLATAEARAKTVASEMKHRIQNNLTLVQAIVRQTFRNSDNLPAAQRVLTDRLAALARAHDLMEHSEAKDLSVERLVRTALEPFDLEHFVLAGPSSVMVPEDFALSVILLIHELATNAAKYGALSSSAGRVGISWAEEPATHEVSIDWKERLGPPVGQPSRAGFGSRLLKAAFAQEGASANVIYEPDGVRCTVSFKGTEPGNALESTRRDQRSEYPKETTTYRTFRSIIR